MSYQITLTPSGHTFSAAADEPLLAAADAAGLTVPYGCRNGVCSVCKATLLEGEVDHGESQEWALPAEQRAAGKVLLCCAKPLSDLVLEVREVSADRDIPVKTLPCRVQKMEKVASDVMILHLKLPASERLQFLAGQYVEFLLKDGKRRAFSLANAPHDDELLQVHVRHVPGGQFTGQVFEAMKEKDILRFEGPRGTFFLREDSTKPAILLAGGTGFAPVKAIVEHAIHNRIERPLYVYWGARDRAGLYLPALPSQWAAAHTNIRYVPVLSDATAADAWTGRRGLVHNAVLEDFADRADGLGGFQVYACGSPAMIDAARTAFVARGLPDGEFFADAFTYAVQ
ncbi:MAG: CDP-6-deoxy-delta-3,4-glucoseen reductase [Rhodocyclaceae bacterium]|jgi:CDP-4-dehydro-6-deoxyglucose reductase|nr:CDP-6-deoxy-delta-3,4-glucoseen reductase [Rhodocyclaceae bacterium]